MAFPCREAYAQMGIHSREELDDLLGAVFRTMGRPFIVHVPVGGQGSVVTGLTDQRLRCPGPRCRAGPPESMRAWGEPPPPRG